MHVNKMIEMTRQGNKKYIQDILENLTPLLLKSMGYCKIKDLYDTEELLQEGYVFILDLIQNHMEGITAYLPYIQMKIKYFYMNYSRGQKAVVYLEEMAGAEGSWEDFIGSTEKDAVFNEIFIEERTALLVGFLGELPELHWQIIDRYFFREQTLVQIAEELKRSYAFIQRTKQRILKELKQKLKNANQGKLDIL